MALYSKLSKYGCSCHLKSVTCSKCCHNCLKKNLLLFFILLGVAVGITLGICLRLYVPAFQEPHLHPREVQYLYFPAEIFLRVMFYITLPLLVSSLVSGIGSLDIKSSGRTGLYVFGYYLSTTLIAIVEGFIYVLCIKPGANIDHSSNLNDTISGELSTGGSSRIDSFMDMIRNMFPDNIVTATFQMDKTSFTFKNISLGSKNESMLVQQFKTEKFDGVTLFTIIFSVALSFTKNKGKPLFQIFELLFETVMKIMNVLLWFYPIGIMFLLATTIVQLQNPVDVLQKVSKFIATALAGLFTHMFIVLPLIFYVCVRKNPYRNMIGCLRALLTAFATSNSAMTLPVTMTCLKRLGYKDSIIRFMAPIGATINMDGTALYQAIAPIFVARMRGMNPGVSQILVLGVTAVAVSVGAPTTVDSMALYIIMFKSIGLPLKDIGVFLAFDWMMSRFRTMVNVAGDCVGVAVVEKLSTKAAEKDVNVESKEGDTEMSHLNNPHQENILEIP